MKQWKSNNCTSKAVFVSFFLKENTFILKASVAKQQISSCLFHMETNKQTFVINNKSNDMVLALVRILENQLVH